MDTELKINGLNQVYGVVDKEVTEIVIPNTVVSIKPNSFKGCKKLKTVKIPDSVNTIGSSAFEGCSSLKEIVLPLNLSIIDANVFTGCTSLRKVYIKDYVDKIALTAFIDCKRVEEFVVSEDNYKFCSVDGSIYNRNKNILYRVPAKTKQINFAINKKVKKIEATAFRGCTTIETVTFPEKETVLRRSVFEGCKSLKEISLPDTIFQVEDSVFSGCSSLKEIKLPDNVTYLPYYCFKDCTSLEKIEFPSNFWGIQDTAFQGCTSLKNVFLPASTCVINNSAFAGCKSLERVDISPDNSKLASVDGIVYSKDMSKIVLYPSAHLQDCYTIPDSVNHLHSDLFDNCKNLREIHIHDFISIESKAFRDCSSLVAIHISVHNLAHAPIDKNAFFGVDKKKCILYVPQRLSSDYRKHPAFSAFDVIEEDIPKDGDHSDLEMVEFSPDGKTLISVKDYCKPYIISFDIPNGITTIGDHAFANCVSLEHVSFPDTLETIQVGAFSRCRNLKQLSLPNSLREIQNYAFAECGSITPNFLPEGVRRLRYNIIDKATISEVYIPSSVKRIDTETFKGCAQLSEIVVSPDNPYFTSIEGVLYNKDMTELISVPQSTKIIDFKIPDSVLTVSENAFHKCTGIKSICLNDAVESFPVSIFTNYLINLDSITVGGESKLYQVKDGVLFSKDGQELVKMLRKAQVQDYVIPDGVKKIHDHAFKGCGKLQTITIPQSVSEIGHSIFDGCKGITTLKLLCALSDLYWYTFTELDKKKCKVYVPEKSFRYGFRGSAIENFDVYSLKELEAGDDPDSEVIVEISVDEKGYALKLGKKTKITGDFHLEDIETISPRIYDYIDVSEATFGSQMEEWSQFLGMSHSGPVYGNSGIRKVDILLRFISNVKVATLVLPDDVQRRHINAAKNNKYIRQLIVRDSCKLFSYVDGKLMNKKKTLIVFESKRREQ